MSWKVKRAELDEDGELGDQAEEGGNCWLAPRMTM